MIRIKSEKYMNATIDGLPVHYVELIGVASSADLVGLRTFARRYLAEGSIAHVPSEAAIYSLDEDGNWVNQFDKSIAGGSGISETEIANSISSLAPITLDREYRLTADNAELTNAAMTDEEVSVDAEPVGSAESI